MPTFLPTRPQDVAALPPATRRLRPATCHLRPATCHLPLLLLLLFLAGCAADSPSPSRVTGFLEAHSIDLAPEIGGRLLEVNAGEGDEVQAGEVVARLDQSFLQLQVAQADALVAQAEARLAQTRTSVRPEDVDLAAANVAFAEAGLAAAESALADATRLRDTPQELNVQIAAAETALAVAEAQAQAALHLAEAADQKTAMWESVTRGLWAGVDVPLPGGGSARVDAPADKVAFANQQWNLAGQEAWAAWQESAAADAAVGQARVVLADLRRQRQTPQAAAQRVVAAEAARDRAGAGVQQAQAALHAVQAGATPVQIAAAEAAVVQAVSARAALAAQLAQTLLVAPITGVVSARYRAPGEVVGPQQRVLTLSDPGALDLTIYLPAASLAALQPGEQLPVIVALQSDAAPARQFLAQILSISDQPEYTLRLAQNLAERADSVYAVHLILPEPDPLLRPGMPVDVVIGAE